MSTPHITSNASCLISSVTLYIINLLTGKGRFGQVYECFNLESGEMNAVKQVYTCKSLMQLEFSKDLILTYPSPVLPPPTPPSFPPHSPLLPHLSQIPIQEKDSGALQTIAEEIQLFQKVQHENIVKFYGVEIHHVS